MFLSLCCNSPIYACTYIHIVCVIMIIILCWVVRTAMGVGFACRTSALACGKFANRRQRGGSWCYHCTQYINIDCIQSAPSCCEWFEVCFLLRANFHAFLVMNGVVWCRFFFVCCENFSNWVMRKQSFWFADEEWDDLLMDVPGCAGEIAKF